MRAMVEHETSDQTQPGWAGASARVRKLLEQIEHRMPPAGGIGANIDLLRMMLLGQVAILLRNQA